MLSPIACSASTPHCSTRGEVGHLVLTVLGMVAHMERRFIKERQRKGIARAKGEDADTGGKRRLDRDHIRALHATGSELALLARAVGCSRMQVYRVLQEIWPGPGDSYCGGHDERKGWVDSGPAALGPENS